MLRVDGEEVYPETSPSGLEFTGKKTERYKDGADYENIMLNPGFYSYSDPDRDAEIDLKQ